VYVYNSILSEILEERHFVYFLKNKAIILDFFLKFLEKNKVFLISGLYLTV
jgi:hypothetical protein